MMPINACIKIIAIVAVVVAGKEVLSNLDDDDWFEDLWE
jgi:hypothetical protein